MAVIHLRALRLPSTSYWVKRRCLRGHGNLSWLHRDAPVSPYAENNYGPRVLDPRVSETRLIKK